VARVDEALAALRLQGFLRYIAAQAASNVGTWIQITVKNWLVLQLSHSGLALGVTNALQFGPSLLLGMYGGVVADRYDRRRLLMVTQACLGALAVGLLAIIGAVRVWMIWIAAGALGLVKCFDLPALQGFAKSSRLALVHAARQDRLAKHPRLDLRSCRRAGCAGRNADAAASACHDLRLRTQRRPGQRDGDQTLQARTSDDMRGRVMALYAMCFNGSALWGRPAFGGFAQRLGVATALATSAAICGLFALAAVIVRQATHQAAQ